LGLNWTGGRASTARPVGRAR